MAQFQGRLHYLGWDRRPWKLLTAAGEVDIWPLIESAFALLNGRRVTQQETRESYILSHDPTAKHIFEYEPDSLAVLSAEKSFSNVTAHLDEALLRANGRLVEVEIEIGGGSFKISADTAEEVFRLNSPLIPRGRLEIPDGAEKVICKIGQGSETCIFLTRSMGEFYCEKFHSPTALERLDRLSKKEIIAGRIGNCALGR